MQQLINIVAMHSIATTMNFYFHLRAKESDSRSTIERDWQQKILFIIII